jgi:hypothetical protein
MNAATAVDAVSITSDADRELEARWAALANKLEQNRKWLGDQGSLVRKKARRGFCWVLRFFVEQDGRWLQRSIYICRGGELELIRRVRLLLAEYRPSVDRSAREVAALARFACTMKVWLQRHSVGLTKSGRARRVADLPTPR